MANESETIVVRTPMRRVDVFGEDRTRYLEDVTSQRLLDVPVTHVRSALVLDAHGAPQAMFDVVVLGDRLALLAPDDQVASTLTDVLGMRTFLLDARFTATDHVAASLRGADADAIARAAGLTVVEGRCRVAGDVLLVHRSANLDAETVGGGVDVIGPPGAVDEAVAALVDAGAVAGESADLDAWRVAAGVPAWGQEVVAPHLPEEAGLLPSHVHLAMGCYPGQAAVARMWMLGRPRRRLASVRVPNDEVAPGWTAGDGRRAVTVTSVSPDGERALAYVPGDATPGAVLADGAIEVVALVGDDPAPPGHDPAVTRRRDRPRG